MQNIIAAIFELESEGYQAITQLKQKPVTEQSAILQMALVKKGENGITVCDSFDSGISTGDDTVMGGLLGGLLGILGGPLGVLLLGSYGALAGSMLDAGDAVAGEALLENVAGKLFDGEVALIVLADEKEEADLDQRIGQFKTQILRYDAAAIAVEVDEAVKVQLDLDRQARRELRKTRQEEFKKNIEEKRAKLNAEFDEYEKKFRDDSFGR